MAKYIVTSPDGQKYEVTAPDDATPEQVKQMVIQVIGRAKQICDQYGLDFNQLVLQAGGGSRGTPPPPPTGASSPPAV